MAPRCSHTYPRLPRQCRTQSCWSSWWKFGCWILKEITSIRWVSSQSDHLHCFTLCRLQDLFVPSPDYPPKETLRHAGIKVQRLLFQTQPLLSAFFTPAILHILEFGRCIYYSMAGLNWLTRGSHKWIRCWTVTQDYRIPLLHFGLINNAFIWCKKQSVM